jgi:hypothetical protein
MNFEREEEAIKKLFQSYCLKKPPESALKDYEQEVLRKVRAFQPKPAFGGQAVLGAAVVATLICLFAFFVRPFLAPKKESVTKPSAVVEYQVPVRPQDAASEDLLGALARDLFILEMLGEDEGLLEELELVTMDVELFQQVQAPL